MLDPNISEGDVYSYEHLRNYVPPSTNITFKQIKEVYKLCEDVKDRGIQKSELYLNCSTYSLGFVSVATYFNRVIWIYFFIAVAIFCYIKWFFSRKDEAHNIEEFANNIMRQMPLSEEETTQAISYAKRIDDLRIKSFEEHSKTFY